MGAGIHPTAIVETGAGLGEGVEIGAYAFVGGQAVLGDGTRLHHHATVEGRTTLGRQCEVFPFACIGMKTHDLKFAGGAPGLRIGDRNVFREFTSVHLATNDGEFTVLGDDNVILAYSHIAHDCVIGGHLVMSSHAALAGHVIVEDHVNVGWNAGVHQFARVGAHAMIGACAKVVQDVPPYVIADGNPAVIRAINRIGLERSGFTAGQIERVKQLYRIFYREGLNRSQALEKLAQHPQAEGPELARFIRFVQTSARGVTPGGS